MFKASIDPYLLVGNAAILTISDTEIADYNYTIKDKIGNTIFVGSVSGLSIQINLSDILKSLVSSPDPSSLLGIDIFKKIDGFVSSFSIDITKGTDLLTLNSKAVMGGIPKAMFRDLAKEGKNIFLSRFFNPKGNFLLTTRTRLNEIMIKETELFPFLLMPFFQSLKIKFGEDLIIAHEEEISDINSVIQVNIAQLRTNYFNEKNKLINRFDFYADDVYSFSVNIIESTSYNARSILFRNSLGAYEKIEVTGVVKYQPEIGIDTDYLRYDAVNDSFTKERERPEADEKYSAEIGYDLPARKLWCRDLLGSEDCYFINDENWYRSKITADKIELESSILEANGLKINIELADKESCYVDESIEKIIPVMGNYSIMNQNNPTLNPSGTSVEYFDCGTNNWNDIIRATNFFTFLDNPISENRPSGLPAPGSGMTIQYRGIRFGINSSNLNEYGVWMLIGNNTIYKVHNYVATEIGSGQSFIGSIDENGHLILTFANGIQQDVGIVVGSKGDKGDKGDQGIQGEKGDKGEKGDQGIQGDQGIKGDKGDKGDQGIQGIKGDDGQPGANGKDGISIPVNLSISKQGTNGIIYPQLYKWITNLTVSSVQLISNCSDISVMINGILYNAISLIGVTIPKGTELTINDLIIKAGYNSANAIIIFTQS
jgi:hypothetical protein